MVERTAPVTSLDEVRRARAARDAAEEALRRLAAEAAEEHGPKTAAEAAGITRQTLDRWRGRWKRP